MVTVKLTFKNLVLLHDAFLKKAGTYYEDAFYDELMREHCIDFCNHLQRYIDRGAKEPKVPFSSLQALVFMHLWVDAPLPGNAGDYVILDLIAIIDKQHKQIKLLQ